MIPSRPLMAEGRWFWRRLFVFGVSLGLLALVLVLYLVAPTAQQILEMLAHVKLRMAGRRG
jgi:uncharacterized BrkB/YihY/UPF0761 family membrane protein